ncbi:tail protein [Pseudomonas sp. 21]|uniref:phage tail protein n=1 Tax=unclassified Pseudomonas TaxID=196821 RepID=UPI0005EB3223|nr:MULTISPECIES: tail fiber protein [unclassified Pseudomonas]KJJ97812.1 tail protein [Pseudomonas sp. 21]MBV7585308.1 tail fiber protein [Pseudomonas sp. PDM33]
MDVDSYIGVVAPFAGSFAPKNWMTCNGQQIRIAQNQALYSLLGTLYGGDGINSFCLPNLGGRVAVGQSANLPLGASAGEEQINLLTSNLPYHTHGATAEATVLLQQSGSAASASQATTSDTLAQSVGATGRDTVTVQIYGPAPGTVGIPAQGQLGVTVANAGSSYPTPLMQPYLALTQCICAFGVFPSRN